MASYVMSDIHGHFDAFQKMLKKIKFTNNDTLYIIGDIIDRGIQNLDMVNYVKNHKNIIMIIGNHEYMASEYLHTNSFFDRKAWFQNGGYITWEEIEECCTEEIKDFMDWVDCLPVKVTTVLNGKTYVLAHANPFLTKKEDIVWERLYPYDKIPDGEDKQAYYIVGHTPTFYFDEKIYGYTDKVAEVKTNEDGHIIFIDCGCAYDDERTRLACIRLEDRKIFYV